MREHDVFDECMCECGRCEWCEYDPEVEPVPGYKWLNTYNGGWNKSTSRLTLLVHGLGPYHDVALDRKHHQRFLCNEFFKVEVVLRPDSKVLQHCCYGPLMAYTRVGSTLRIGSNVYVIRSSFWHGYNTIPDSLTPKLSNKPIQCLKGMSWFDLDSIEASHQTWNRGAWPEELYNNGDLHCVALDGYIYCFVSNSLNYSLVYNPRSDKWFNFDPKHPKWLSRFCISLALIPDPNNKRILVHLSGQSLSSIFAWYPQRDSNNWVHIKPDVTDRVWTKAKPTLVAGGSMLVFFLRESKQLFRVLDLETKEWVTVRWTSPYGQHLGMYKVKSIFYMGDDQLCLCFSQGFLPPSSGFLAFIAIIEFKRCTDSLIKFTHRFTKSFYTGQIDPVHFIPLS